MCAKPGLQLLGCVRRLGGSQRRLAPPHSCGVAPSAPSRFLSTTNGFAVAAPGRHGGSALSSTGRGGELVESWRSLSSLSFRDPRKLQSPLRLEAVDHSVSQQEATSEDPTSRQSHPPNSSSSSSNSSSEDSSNENSSSSSSSSINNNKSNDSVSQSEGREGALGGRDEVAELQRLLRERQQRQADVIPFRVRRTASDNLPVNLSWSHSRSQVRTVIRKVRGDRQVFMRELAILCQSPVWEGEGCICVSGNKKAIVRQWLQELGF